MAGSSWASQFCLLVVLVVTRLQGVDSCSCVVNPSTVERPAGIRNDYCNSYTTDVYSAVVESATCNCIPDASDPSLLVNCYHLQLDSRGNYINATLLTRGRCDYARYESYFATSCSFLTTSVATGFTLEITGDESNQPFVNLTVGGPFDECGPSCPLNNVAPENSLLGNRDAYQACFYTVRIMETFKGNYSRDEVRIVAGPDTQTSCGDVRRRLQIGTEYIAGIGGSCSPIEEWSERSSYSTEEIQQLREEINCEATSSSPSPTTVSAGPCLLPSFLAFLLTTAVATMLQL